MKHSDLILSICFVGVVILLCCYSEFVADSFADGLQLWYNDLVPILLPFLLLSGLFLSMLHLEHPNKIVCLILLFFCGLFCGYPIGAMVIGRMYEHHVISKRFACSILPLCNNVSPMFLVGYVYHPYLADAISFSLCICLIYLPQLLYAGCYFLFSSLFNHRKHTEIVDARSVQEELAATDTDTSVIMDSIRTITIVGIYIAIFSVAYELCRILLPDSVPFSFIPCFLEITKGIPELMSFAVSETEKTALCLSLTAFGGISSLFQSMHVLKNTDLSFCNYIFGKSICAGLTFSCAQYAFMCVSLVI